jgi:hypothetical protein
VIEDYQLSEETQMLLAVAVQKWIESVAYGDGRYDCPLEINGACIFVVFCGYNREPDSIEYIDSIKKLNDYLYEKYDIPRHFNTAESESPTEPQ